MLQRYDARESRFSARVLRALASTALSRQFAIRAADDVTPAEILVYDEIGPWGITAKDFVLALSRIPEGPLNVRINSPGGDVFDGMAIYNALLARKGPVIVTVDGLAASAASLIAMAGATVRMAEASMLMIHNCWGICIGNRNDMMDAATVQEKIDGQMAQIYSARSGMTKEAAAAVMDAETWYTSTEAKSVGFCNTILPGAVAPGGAARAMAYGGARARAAVMPYDPDGDGDNDAQDALGLIQSAMVLLEEAAETLTGTDDDAEPDATMARRKPAGKPRAAATEPEWVVGAADGLAIDTEATWDGPGASARILDDAGFNGLNPDPAKAKLGFLVWDHHNPNLKGSYKLPFADLIGGEMTAVKAGIEASASMLSETDIPPGVKARARDVIDAYEAKIRQAQQAAHRSRRLRVREAA